MDIEAFLASGADVDSVDPNQNKPLHYSCKPEKGLEELFLSVTELLLKKGANVNAQGWCLNTPLLVASSVAHTPTVKILIKANADIESRNSEGQSALMLASMVDQPHSSFDSCVACLIQARADVSAIDLSGKNSLRYATELGRTRAVRLLESEFLILEKLELISSPKTNQQHDHHQSDSSLYSFFGLPNFDCSCSRERC